MQTLTVDESTVRTALESVVDPELNCNLVDLGLIYGIAINGQLVTVTMTLTTPGCPMHESLAVGVQRVVLELPGVEEVKVAVVWDPSWNYSMASDYGRSCLGIE